MKYKFSSKHCPKCGGKIRLGGLPRCEDCGFFPDQQVNNYDREEKYDPDNPNIKSPSERGHLNREIK